MKEVKEELLQGSPEDFFTQFESEEAFQSFMDALFNKRVVNFLEAEMDDHLGYSKDKKAAASNSRNSKTSKKIKTPRGSYRIEVPCDSQNSFAPKAVP